MPRLRRDFDEERAAKKRHRARLRAEGRCDSCGKPNDRAPKSKCSRCMARDCDGWKRQNDRVRRQREARKIASNPIGRPLGGFRRTRKREIRNPLGLPILASYTNEPRNWPSELKRRKARNGENVQ